MRCYSAIIFPSNEAPHGAHCMEGGLFAKMILGGDFLGDGAYSRIYGKQMNLSTFQDRLNS